MVGWGRELREAGSRYHENCIDKMQYGLALTADL